MKAQFLLAILLCCVAAKGSDTANEYKHVSPLALGSAPECSDQDGTRTYRSEIAEDRDLKAFFVGTTTRSGKTCTRSVVMHLNRGTVQKTINLSNKEGESFDIVDFSSDGSSILLVDHIPKSPPNLDHRDVQLAVVNATDMTVHWRNTWDVFHWGNCAATVEPQGFLRTGELVIGVRPSTWQSKVQPDCVSGWNLESVARDFQHVYHLSSSYETARFGKRSRPGFEACKTDPDVDGKCEWIHGRLSIYNGCCNERIWEIGTHHMLYIYGEIMPESLTPKINWDHKLLGDYLVCPLEKFKQGHMQAVCVENARHLVSKPD